MCWNYGRQEHQIHSIQVGVLGVSSTAHRDIIHIPVLEGKEDFSTLDSPPDSWSYSVLASSCKERDCLNPAALSSALKLFLLEVRKKLVQLTGFGISESQKIHKAGPQGYINNNNS